MNINFIVENLIETYNTRDPFALCELLDIKVLFWDLEDTKGFYKKVLGKKYIVIDKNLSYFKKEVVASHELGHAIIHDYNDVILMKDTFMFPKHDKFEREANEFAANLLINDDEDYMGKYNPEGEFDQWLYEELLNYI